MIMKYYKRFFKESISSVVYHMTYITSVIDILQTNRFKCSLSVTSDYQDIAKKLFYFSVSRIKWSGYFETNVTDGICILELDGKKFNQKYKGSPFDYWGHAYRQQRYNVQSDFKKGIEAFLKSDENEERIYSDKLYIPDAIKYIKAIHIYISEKIYSSFRKEITQLKELTYNKNIPIYYYEKLSYFKVLRNGVLLKDEIPLYIIMADILSHTNIKDLHPMSRQIVQKILHVGYTPVSHEHLLSSITELKDSTRAINQQALEQLQYFCKKNKLKSLFDKKAIDIINNYIFTYYA